MNSEKVKEIKKALEEQTQHKPINCINSEYVEACGMYCRHHREFVADMGIKNGQTCENCNKFTATDEVKEYADILTYINELEKENKILESTKNRLTFAEILTILNLINELKSENERLKKENAVKTDTITDLLNKQEFYEKEKLKQFVEKLKRKVTIRHEFIGDFSILVNTIEYLKVEAIDETLKEFLGK